MRLRPTPVLVAGLVVCALGAAVPAMAAPGVPGAAPEVKPDAEASSKPDAGAVQAPVQASPQVSPQAAPIVLANHRAVYDLSLAEGGGTRSVEGARGRIVVDFRGDACRGYTMQTRQVVELTSGETGPRLTDMRSTTFEGGQGREFRFKTTTLTDEKPAPPVDGTATESADRLSVKLKGAKPFTDAGPVLFPSLHMRRLIEAARAGQTTLSAKVYDGSDDGRRVYDTFAVIGHPTAVPAADGAAPARDKPLRTGALAAMPHWPVRLSYYTAGAGERTPAYTLGFDLYENGVSGALRLDYGDFAILGDMTALDIDAGKDGSAKDSSGKDGPRDAGKGCTP